MATPPRKTTSVVFEDRAHTLFFSGAGQFSLESVEESNRKAYNGSGTERWAF
jgi:hypothetical protein